MGQRTGLEDLKYAFTIASGIIAVYNVIGRGAAMAEEKARHEQTKAHLTTIERGIKSINAKLSK